MGPASKVGVDISGVGLDLVAELVEPLEGGIAMDGREVGSLEVGFTILNIGWCHC